MEFFSKWEHLQELGNAATLGVGCNQVPRVRMFECKAPMLPAMTQKFLTQKLWSSGAAIS